MPLKVITLTNDNGCSEPEASKPSPRNSGTPVNNPRTHTTGPADDPVSSGDDTQARKVNTNDIPVSIDDIYILGRLLSGGPNSKSHVYEASIVEDDSVIGPRGSRVAVKATQIQRCAKRAQRQRWELKGLEKAGRHSNILAAYENIIDHAEGWGYMITELCRTDMFEVTQFTLPYECAMPLFRQMVSAVEHIHHRNMCHRDIKLENFFLSFPETINVEDIKDPEKVDKFTVKLGDFGFWGRTYENGSEVRHTCSCGSDVFSPPEQLLPKLARRAEGYDGKKSDIFGLGVCLFTLCCGHPPWNSIRSGTDPYFRLWAQGKARSLWSVMEKHSPNGPASNPAFRDLTTRMMAVNPDERPSFQQIMSHPFITGRKMTGSSRMSDKLVSREMSQSVLSAMRNCEITESD